jgi:ABC-type dipeptide/oligopeptide/nickel transport system permease subunit
MDPRAIARFRKNRGALVGLAIVVAIVLFSFLGPLLTPHSPIIPDFEHGTGPFGTPGHPSRLHWLGTDTIFRDLFARLAMGGRLSLEVAFVATVIAMGIGTAIGVLSGYFKGTRTRVDHLADALALMVAALGAMSVTIFHESLLGYRLLAFAGYALVAAMALRLVARIFAWVGGGLRPFAATDLVDTLLLAVVSYSVVHRGAQALGNHAVVGTVVASGLANLGFRALYARRSSGYSQRPIPFLRIDFDDALMRVVDVLLSFPFLLLLMAISAAVDHTSEATIFLVLGLTAWTGTARVIRSKTLQVRELEFIVASRALGQPTPWILVRHILPNVAGIAIILATNSVASMIVAEAALSFLGLSVPPPSASWGRMLEEGRSYYTAAPWLILAPSIAILLAVLGFNLLGEGLRDAFDPKDV